MNEWEERILPSLITLSGASSHRPRRPNSDYSLLLSVTILAAKSKYFHSIPRQRPLCLVHRHQRIANLHDRKLTRKALSSSL